MIPGIQDFFLFEGIAAIDAFFGMFNLLFATLWAIFLIWRFHEQSLYLYCLNSKEWGILGEKG